MRHALPVLAIAAVTIAIPPARADFYSIEGRFQCLDKPGTVCFDATVPHGTSLLSLSAPSSAQPPALQPPAPAAAAAEPLPPSPDVPAAAPAAKPDDPMLAIAARIKAGAPGANDLATLRRAADVGDKRALELLAWCSLRGIGMAADAMAAYTLYGEAAAAAVPQAAANQKLVFERYLTSAERERVLEEQARAERPHNLAAGRDLPEIP